MNRKKIRRNMTNLNNSHTEKQKTSLDTTRWLIKGSLMVPGTTFLWCTLIVTYATSSVGNFHL